LKRSKFELPLRATLLYLLFGSLWILLSDQILSSVLLHNPQEAVFQTLKGWFFIVVSGIVLYLLLLRDLTARQQADEARRRGEGLLLQTGEMTKTGGWELDLQNMKLVWSPETYRIHEVDPSLEPDLENAINFYQPDSRPIIREAVQRAIDEGQPYDLELAIVTAKGKPLWIRTMGQAEFRDGKCVRLFGTFQDITERKEAERETIQLKRLYATLSQVNQMIVRVKEEQELYQAICDVAVRFGEFVLAWVGLLDESDGNVRPVAASGLDIEQWPFALVNINTGQVMDGLIARAIRSSQVVVSDDMQTDQSMQSVHEMFKRRGYRASAGVPFRVRGRTIGVLNLVSKEAGFFQSPAEIRLLDEMGLDISFALDIIQNELERRQAEAEILNLAKFPNENPNPVLRIAADGTLLYANSSSERLLKFWMSTTGSKIPDHLREMISNALEVGKPSEIEIDCEGTIFLLTFAPISDAGYVNVYGRNITDRKQAEELFHYVVESAPNAILLVNREGRLHLVNAQAENYFGYNRAELLGMNIDRLIPDRFRGRHSDQRADFFANPQPRLMGMGRDLHGLRKDGTEFPAEVGLTPIDSQGEPLVMVTVVDSTVRKHTEARVQRQLKRLNALRMIDIAISSSFDRGVIFDVVLQQVTSQLGVDACALFLFNNQLQTIEYASSRGFRFTPFEAAQVKLGEGYAARVVLERKTIHISNHTEPAGRLNIPPQLGNEAFVDYYGTPLIIKGEVKGILETYHRSSLDPDQEWLDFLEALAGQAGIASDNTQLFSNMQRTNAQLERRVMERTMELNQTNAELEHANRAKDEFLANMSHELRTPLTGILGLSESLLEERRGSLNDYQQRSLQIIESSGHHLLELINDILDLSKIEAGKFDFYPQGVLVNELCKACLTFINSQAAKKSIRVNYVNEAQVLEIFADARRLKQILVNLLSNAVKFTPEHGSITLRVATRLDQDLIQFSVIDTGIGIASEDMHRLFHPFVQVDSSLNRHHEGSGLGLALVQKLTDLHGGSVHVESDGVPGKGSRFIVNLNCRQDIISKSAGPELPRELGEVESAQQPAILPDEPVHRDLILLAEDNLPNILTIGEYLESHGFEVVTAHDGMEAIARAAEHSPDLILMDIQMPVMNGLEAIARLRGDERFGSTPIIALTALAMPGDRERCLQVGASEYMSKPVSLKHLVGLIESLLDRGKNKPKSL